eukprot:TRINITY_DN4010_c0_g1_i4.p1 TRINITY_DN4010_c0_g1~~TRINITY_DN4010_c0_g1_i4.p1  ORF type:complete len:336 (+),score=49.87 TRINITY_DN4010_c0_g1_i4:49-1056(+)
MFSCICEVVVQRLEQEPESSHRAHTFGGQSTPTHALLHLASQRGSRRWGGARRAVTAVLLVPRPCRRGHTGVLDGRGNLDAYGLWARGPAAVEAYALISARQASNGVVRTVWRAPRWTGEVSATTDAATLVGTVLRQVGTRWAVGGEVGYSFRDESPGVSVGLRFASAAGTSGTPAAQSAGSAGARWRAGLGVPARQSVGAVSEAAELAEPGAFVVTAAASHMGHVVASFAKRLLQPGLAAGAQYYYNYYSQSSSLAVGVAFGSAGFCWQVCADTSKGVGVAVKGTAGTGSLSEWRYVLSAVLGAGQPVFGVGLEWGDTAAQPPHVGLCDAAGVA